MTATEKYDLLLEKFRPFKEELEKYPVGTFALIDIEGFEIGAFVDLDKIISNEGRGDCKRRL